MPGASAQGAAPRRAHGRDELKEEKEDIARFILDINSEWDTTIILIEHDMAVVMDISDRLAVLDHGRKIAEGSPKEVQQHPAVLTAYLGRETTTKGGK